MLRPVASVTLIAVLATIAPVAANEEDAATLRDYGRAEIAAPGRLCDCLLRQFAKLTEGQQTLVAATVRDDPTAIAAARADLAGAELAQAEAFLKTETLLCRPSR
jgi:hypothetical protein